MRHFQFDGPYLFTLRCPGNNDITVSKSDAITSNNLNVHDCVIKCMFIALMLVNNNLKKYLYAYNIDETTSKLLIDNKTTIIYNNEKLCNLKSQMMNYLNFCKTHKCFYKFQNYYT